MNIKLDENSKEYKELSTALDIVNKKIADINARAIKALEEGSADSLNIELLNLLKSRDEICDNNRKTISKFLSTELNEDCENE